MEKTNRVSIDKHPFDGPSSFEKDKTALHHISLGWKNIVISALAVDRSLRAADDWGPSSMSGRVTILLRDAAEHKQAELPGILIRNSIDGV